MDGTFLIKNLVFSREFAGRVLPYLKDEFFHDPVEKRLFEVYDEYVTTYKDIPDPDVIEVGFKKIKGLAQVDFDRGLDFIKGLKQPYKTPDLQYLIDETEKWCQHQSCYNAISKSISILDGEAGLTTTAIPEILKEAVSISFNTDIGHDYIDNVEDRFNKLHEQTARLKTGIGWLDEALGGGYPRKTLNLFLAASGGGKSLMKSHLAAHFYREGYNVLYVTLELAEERIGERADANLMDIDVSDIAALDLDTYKNKVEKIADKTKGRLYIKEFPPATITPQHIRALLDELRLKKGFKPDVLIVDYLNLMNSSRFKASSGANSYTILKAVAEELRGIAAERDLVCISSTQMNRTAIQGSDPDMTGVSDSLGIVMTADTLFAMVRSEELDALKQIMLKCLKTRFSSMTNQRTLVGINWNRMQVKDLGNMSGNQYVAQPMSSEPVVTPELKPAFASKKPKKKFEDISV